MTVMLLEFQKKSFMKNKAEMYEKMKLSVVIDKNIYGQQMDVIRHLCNTNEM